MERKTFAEDFYNEVLKPADDNQNVRSFVIHTNCGSIIRLDVGRVEDPRLSTVGVTDNFIAMSDCLVGNFNADEVLIPHNSVDFIEIYYKRIK